MQSSLFEPGRPVIFTRSTCVSVVVYVARKLRPCLSYSRRRDRINLVLWRSLDKGGAGYLKWASHCWFSTHIFIFSLRNFFLVLGGWVGGSASGGWVRQIIPPSPPLMSKTLPRTEMT